MLNVIQLYLQHHESSDHSVATLKFYRERLGRFQTSLYERDYPTDVEAVRAPHLREFITHLQKDSTRPDGRPPSPSYAHGHIRAVKAFSHWCYDEELIDRKHMDKVKRPKLPVEAKPTYTKAEIEKLLNACDRRTLAGARNFAAMLLL